MNNRLDHHTASCPAAARDLRFELFIAVNRKHQGSNAARSLDLRLQAPGQTWRRWQTFRDPGSARFLPSNNCAKRRNGPELIPILGGLRFKSDGDLFQEAVEIGRAEFSSGDREGGPRSD